MGTERYELALPKGRMGAGEAIIDAANREIMEEIGYAAKPSQVIAPGNPKDHESEETTHFTVIDDEGNISGLF